MAETEEPIQTPPEGYIELNLPEIPIKSNTPEL